MLGTPSCCDAPVGWKRRGSRHADKQIMSLEDQSCLHVCSTLKKSLWFYSLLLNQTAAVGGVTYNFLLVSVASHTDFMTLPCSPLEDLRYGPVCRRRVDHATLPFQILW